MRRAILLAALLLAGCGETRGTQPATLIPECMTPASLHTSVHKELPSPHGTTQVPLC